VFEHGGTPTGQRDSGLLRVDWDAVDVWPHDVQRRNTSIGFVFDCATTFDWPLPHFAQIDMEHPRKS